MFYRSIQWVDCIVFFLTKMKSIEGPFVLMEFSLMKPIQKESAHRGTFYGGLLPFLWLVGKDLGNHLLDWYFLLIYGSVAIHLLWKALKQWGSRNPTNTHKCIWWLATIEVVLNDESRAAVTTGKCNYMCAGAVKSTARCCWPRQCGLKCDQSMFS